MDPTKNLEKHLRGQRTAPASLLKIIVAGVQRQVTDVHINGPTDPQLASSSTWRKCDPRAAPIQFLPPLEAPHLRTLATETTDTAEVW